MAQSESAVWLECVVERRDGYEWQAVEQFSERLLRFAGSRMPDVLRGRVDADDVVQSAFRSFFVRNSDGQFQFSEMADIWRLLAAITYRKVQRAIRHHSQQQRDVRRETRSENAVFLTEHNDPTASSMMLMAETLSGILRQLPETHQRVVQLRLDGFSIEEIGVKLGISTRTVNRGLALARKVAADLMEET